MDLYENVRRFFEENPEAVRCFGTSDGNVFPPKNEELGRGHARTLREEIQEFRRAEFFTEEEKKENKKKEAKGEDPKEGSSEENGEGSTEQEHFSSAKEVQEASKKARDQGIIKKNKNGQYEYDGRELGGTVKELNDTLKENPYLFDELTGVSTNSENS
jgi:hypothetical protein